MGLTMTSIPAELPPTLAGTVAVVTGASRGIGQGIALALGEQGATVYVTGRSRQPGSSRWPGSVAETAQQVTGLGGQGIPAQLDHRDDAAVQGLFQRVQADQGHLELLVNNATGFADTPSGYPPEGVPCWELPVGLWDELHTVGLRSHYVASVYAAPLLIAGGRGLIVNISSFGAVAYAYGVAYGAAKAGLDKLSADLAHELGPYRVAVVSLWPPLTTTEKVLARADRYELSGARSPLLTGRAVAALAADPEVLQRTGRALAVTDLAEEYGFGDLDPPPQASAGGG
jgi:dehydrogenase/reductase SDR family member 1